MGTGTDRGDVRRSGVVVRAFGKRFTVRSGGLDVDCKVRTQIKKDSPDVTPVTAGDDVEFILTGDGQGIIERVLPRRTSFFRHSKGRSSKKQVLAANIDQLVIVESIHEPPLKPTLVDRFIVAAELGRLQPVVVLNKADLGLTPTVGELVDGYRRIEIPVFVTSAADGRGLEELRCELAGKRSLFVGHSGVGKSTLLNELIPGLDIRTADISESTGKGRHTTTHVELHEFPSGGYLVDSPGLKVLSLWELTAEELPWRFREFERFSSECRFRDCAHLSEPDCAVQAAVACGDIPEFRYQSYLQIRQSLIGA
ncbi:MAG TPA: ribosome small subunit-dependent GTPase A [candidate division Zixibacteria bacterium]|nr:ribosome small subunit-dependent GTPase A [candidate division Zixibacteria bacterium]